MSDIQGKSFYLKSMGCKSNQFEGNVLRKYLLDYGLVETLDIKAADYFILNSCSVTHKSDNEAFYLLRNAKNLNNNIKTVLTGCVAQLSDKDILKNNHIDYVFGNDDKFRITELLSSETFYSVSDVMTLSKFNYQCLNNIDKTRISIKIQDGCDNRCSYCVIPFARGKSRSAEIDFIINQINEAYSNGFKEAVLTGIHIGQWGYDLDKNLSDLLLEIDRSTSIPRYRLGSLNPLEISNELLDILEASNKFCPHFHLSLQSACNKTLKAMNRFYTVEEYLNQIEDIKSRFKNVFLGSDIIAGFPGETLDDFKITLSNLERSGLTKIHTFPYSVRKGTVASTLLNQVEDIEKQRRADIIKEISQKKYNEFINNNLNTVHTVLIEKKIDKKTGLLKGVTENYLNVIIKNNDIDYTAYFNTLRQVQLTEYKDNILYANLA